MITHLHNYQSTWINFKMSMYLFKRQINKRGLALLSCFCVYALVRRREKDRNGCIDAHVFVGATGARSSGVGTNLQGKGRNGSELEGRAVSFIPFSVGFIS